ncbi:NAD(P)-dependent oxidoreductase [Plantibacter flavus]|uniref:NAD(P)-dependent oxidoreductase n=1 Tax=Plantibacter TaxID=190323 RepID=UPI002378AA41|nr:NAD(P)-binding oxidoreductase [Plantibacter flavus]MDD9153394.1 SDR family oxidoreductase [Plantibacter flavus]
MFDDLEATVAQLLVIGGSGRTGRLIISEALRSGHSVTALVRDPAAVVPGDRLTVVQGSPLRSEDVEEAMRGVQAVIIALSNIGSSDWPWARQVSPPDLISNAVRVATDAMRSRGLRRIVLLSALGAGESVRSVPAGLRWATHFLRLGTVYADHEQADAFLRRSELDWTIVHPTVLSASDARRPVVSSPPGSWPSSLRIPRCDVAAFLVDAVDDEDLIGSAPVISSGPRRS